MEAVYGACSDCCLLLFQQLKDALGEVVAEMENMDTADEG
jgi:hypothetical protein